jgi:hypothetical protein
MACGATIMYASVQVQKEHGMALADRRLFDDAGKRAGTSGQRSKHVSASTNPMPGRQADAAMRRCGDAAKKKGAAIAIT